MSVSRLPLFRGAFADLLFDTATYEGVIGPDVAAVLVEPMVQGAGGMRVQTPEFLKSVAANCRAAGALLIADEVMTGFGRTGRMFACEHASVRPDILCLSKGITGGFLPFAATLASERVYDAFLSGDATRTFFHGHSYTANPLGCAAALASLRIFEEESVLERTQAIGARLAGALAPLRDHPRVADVRGLGTIQAVEIRADGGYLAEVGARLRAESLRRGVLLRPLGNVLYAMPPYCVTDGEVDLIAATMRDLIDLVQ
jgi:adenosylmethionine-8-amino-7-oxononanoate aminotransferase